MITNQRQYAITRTQLARFEEALGAASGLRAWLIAARQILSRGPISRDRLTGMLLDVSCELGEGGGTSSVEPARDRLLPRWTLLGVVALDQSFVLAQELFSSLRTPARGHVLG